MGSPSEWESRVSSVHDRLTLRRRGKGEKAFHFYDVAVIPRSRLERLTSSLLVKRSTTELSGRYKLSQWLKYNNVALIWDNEYYVGP